MGEIRTFRDDDILKPLLDAIPKKKRSKIVRRALYNYFFKGENKMIVEIEEGYIDNHYEILEEEKPTTTNTIREIKFDMFDD